MQQSWKGSPNSQVNINAASCKAVYQHSEIPSFQAYRGYLNTGTGDQGMWFYWRNITIVWGMDVAE